MTIGYQARMQFNAAKLMTNYGSELNSLYNSYTSTGKFNVNAIKKTGSTDALNKLLNSRALKSKSDEFRSQFSDLYKSIYNIKDDSSESSDIVSPQATKLASANAGGSAESIKSFADGLKYGKDDEFNIEDYKKYAQNFVDNYNEFIDKIGNSDNTTVLKKGVLAVNNAKVYSNALNRAGITLGSDNKLTLQSDLSKVDKIDVKSTFGKGGFSDAVIRRAREINQASGGMGIFTKQNVGSTKKDESSSAAESGTLKELTAAVKDAATAVKSYTNALGSGEKTFNAVDFTDTASSFIEKYNKLLDASDNSDNLSVQYKGSALRSVTNSYKYALKRAGIEVGKNGKLSLSEQAAEKVTEKDIGYAFGGSYLEKLNQKVDQISSLATSASAMGYNSDSTAAYAYNSGALFSVYA